MPDIAVIICTHNPRPDYLRRTLDALEAQTLPRQRWELLLVDNASSDPVASHCDLSWHPHARHIREDELGLAAARLRGIREAAGDLLVFVDDDNLLAENYLQLALEIGAKLPHIGVWGGQVHPIFEAPPPAWVASYLNLLACREFQFDRWSNIRATTKAFLAAPECVCAALSR